MLIIAIPKSASTALLATLGVLHRVPHRQVMFPECARLPDFPLLGQLHSDVRELQAAGVDAFADPNRLFKQHVAPTAAHRQWLKAHRKVILLREPEGVVRAYFRGVQSGVHNRFPLLEGAQTLADWEAQAARCGLLDELRRFERGWLEDAGERLVVRYEDLMADPGQVVRAVERYWEWPVHKGPIHLVKRRYSRREGAVERWRSRWWSLKQRMRGLSAQRLASGLRRLIE